MEEVCSRVSFSLLGGPLLSCSVSQSAETDSFSTPQPVRTDRRPAARRDVTPPPGPVPVSCDRRQAPSPDTPSVGVPWPAGCRVAPLFELCLQLAAGWLDRLDSLDGFPELVGELLVRRALQRGVFDRPDGRCRRALAVCVAAYPDQVLPCLRVADQLTLSEYEESLESAWAGVTRLDLSGCRLGDRHPVISHIATLTRLTHLHLRNCLLTDAGLRNLTLPARMSGTALGALRCVDVRENQLSDRSLVMLCRLRPERIVASVPVKADTEAALAGRGYRLVEPFDAEGLRRSDGWLDSLPDRWSRLAARPPTKRARTERSDAVRFYGRPAGTVRSPADRPDRPRCPPAVYLQRLTDD